MNSRDRFLIAMEGGIADRVPVVYLGFGASTAILNRLKVTWQDLWGHGRVIGSAMLKALELWRFDNLTVFLQPEVGLDTLTCSKKFRYPYPLGVYREPFIKNENELGKLVFPEFRGKNTMRGIVEAAEYLHRRVGKEVALVGGFGGVSTWALLLRGTRNFFRDLKHDVLFQQKYLRFLTDVGIEYSRAQIDAGCDCILTMEDLFAMEMLGPTAYDLLGPYIRALADAIHEEGGRYMLHCCGNCEPALEEMLRTGADAISVDRVNLSSFKNKLARRAAVVGNVKTSVLSYKSPRDVEENCIEALCAGKQGGGYLLSSGYICPANIPEENMKKLVFSAEKYGRY